MDPVTLAFLGILAKSVGDHAENVAASKILAAWDRAVVEKGAVNRRIAIPQKVRDAIERERRTCEYGGLFSGCSGPLHVDHEYLLAQGGTNYSKNLRLVCQRHNASKGKQLPRDFNPGRRPR